MNIYFTKYAEQKFHLLEKHKVFLDKDQVESAVKKPDKVDKKGKYLSAKKNNIKVVYQKEDDTLKIITFYPVSSE